MATINKQSLDELIKVAKKMGASDAKIIRPEDVAVRNWVRLKCQFGCGGYNRSLTCPPYSPTPDETRQILKEYKWAMLMKFGGAPARDGDGAEVYESSLPKLVVKIEREIFLMGYYAAFGLAAGPCSLCEEECDLERCRHPHEARPSMESCGIDVFTTIRNAGFDINVVKSRNDKPTFYGLLLIG